MGEPYWPHPTSVTRQIRPGCTHEWIRTLPLGHWSASATGTDSSGEVVVEMAIDPPVTWDVAAWDASIVVAGPAAHFEGTVSGGGTGGIGISGGTSMYVSMDAYDVDGNYVGGAGAGGWQSWTFLSCRASVNCMGGFSINVPPAAGGGGGNGVKTIRSTLWWWDGPAGKSVAFHGSWSGDLHVILVPR
jgi:hypothetical protein